MRVATELPPPPPPDAAPPDVPPPIGVGELAHDVRRVDWRNRDYELLFDGELRTFRLADGEYADADGLYSISISGQEFGDLNGDGIEDAVVSLSDPTGTGYTVCAFGYTISGGRVRLLGEVRCGRAHHGVGDMHAFAIVDGAVSVQSTHRFDLGTLELSAAEQRDRERRLEADHRDQDPDVEHFERWTWDGSAFREDLDGWRIQPWRGRPARLPKDSPNAMTYEAAPADPSKKGVHAVDWNNRSYPVPGGQGPVETTFVNGRADTAQIDAIALGDITGDKVDEAVVLLRQGTWTAALVFAKGMAAPTGSFLAAEQVTVRDGAVYLSRKVTGNDVEFALQHEKWVWKRGRFQPDFSAWRRSRIDATAAAR